jgi:hypothetical protein
MKSTIGRPRRLTDQQIAAILAWHEQIRAWRVLRKAFKTQRQLARELGVSPATISYVIARRGEFKQPSPDRRDGEIGRRRKKLEKQRSRRMARQEETPKTALELQRK